MVYYTNYTLDIEIPREILNKEIDKCKCNISFPYNAKFCHQCGNKIESLSIEYVINDFREVNESAAYAIGQDGCPRVSCKWYEHQTDLALFSKKYPDLLFILRGEGEEPGDLWVFFAKNGKAYKDKAKIVFEEFDAKKLK